MSSVDETRGAMRSRKKRLLFLATIAAILFVDGVVLLPAVLVGTNAVTIQRDLGINSGFIGVLVAAFFLTGSC
jgi:hypothetical protein